MKNVSQSTLRSLVKATSGCLCIGMLAAGTTIGCKNDDPPPPLPEAKPAATPTTLELEPPEEEEEEEEEEKKKGTGVRKPSGPLAACCQALRQNAESAPPETQAHMRNAASACDAANAAGSKAGFLAGLAGLLGGAGAPAACK